MDYNESSILNMEPDDKIMSLLNKWDKDLMDLKEFNFKDITTIGRSYYVYDGDTIRVACYFNNELYRFNVRLDGYDTPELRTRSVQEKEAGYKARDWLREKLSEKSVWVKCKDYDKYGRLLADVYVIDDSSNIKSIDNYESINERIVKEGYAVKYNGGKKTDWESLIIEKGYPISFV